MNPKTTNSTKKTSLLRRWLPALIITAAVVNTPYFESAIDSPPENIPTIRLYVNIILFVAIAAVIIRSRQEKK